MPLTYNGSTITRVQHNGTYYRTVVRNGSTVFNLSDWTYTGTSGSFNISTSYTYGYYQYAFQVPEGQLSSWLGSNYPVQNYGAGQRVLVAIYAYIYNPFTYQYEYQYIRNEYYQINQTT